MTLPSDQFLNYYKQDNVVSDNPSNSGYQLADGTPVGIILMTQSPKTVPKETRVILGKGAAEGPWAENKTGDAMGHASGQRSL